LTTDKRYQWQRLIDAVKARDVGVALACFHSPTIALHLTGKLWEQVGIRLFKLKPKNT
jgi:hypothetical protein